jgi:hypothetical protein
MGSLVGFLREAIVQVDLNAQLLRQARRELAVQLRNSATSAINCYFLNVFAYFWREVRKAFWLFDSFVVDIVSFEVIADVGFMDIPQRLLDPPALIGDQLVFLMREILNTLPNARPTLKPTGIAVSIIIIARFPASLSVSGYARQCRRPQPAILLVFRVRKRP